MKELTRKFNGQNVRVIVQKGIEWFVARDVCEILDIKIDGHTFSDFSEREADRYTIPVRSSNGIEQNRSFTIINEPGLYRLIFKSRKPEAETFKSWVFEEVLPSIRKTGKYDVRDMRGKSVEARHMITGEWKRQGVSKPQEYAGLTRKEYDCLFGDPNLKKVDMDKKQVAALFALEAVEYMKLAEIPENRLGYNGCEHSISQTAVFLEQVKKSALPTPARVSA